MSNRLKDKPNPASGWTTGRLGADTAPRQTIQQVAPIYLDISRLLSACRRRTPSGVERVELAYAKQFGGSIGTRFVAYFLGGLHFLPSALAAAYIAAIENAWSVSGRSNRAKAMAIMALIYLVLLATAWRALLPKAAGAGQARSVYLNLSHQNLARRAAIKNFKSRSGAKAVVFVHDLIPITHPEYARPGQAREHRRRMDAVAALADMVLVNSAATKADFLRYMQGRSKLPDIHVVHIGVEPTARVGDSTVAPPYFLLLATIEPRKNHLLLLNLWRSLAAESPVTPRLVIAGRRGWENEMVLDMLERCAAIAPMVDEMGNLRDDELAPLLRGATALLLPSFAEGYGLPVAEALAAGTPVICSDLPALREVGGDVPEYLDPLDGPAWRQAILDYAVPSSPRRMAQLERLVSWSPPGWDRHFEQLAAILR